MKKKKLKPQKLNFNRVYLRKIYHKWVFILLNKSADGFIQKIYSLINNYWKKYAVNTFSFLKHFKCKLPRGGIFYIIIIDGYVQNKGENFIVGI